MRPLTSELKPYLPRPELLAPAGSLDAFAAALAAGADAIYCGFGSFNARRKATNFTDEQFGSACRAAHVAGARVYVTVNIVIKDEEMAQALELIRRASELGADAFIIQDWGLFAELRRYMPWAEIHISTQANIHDARATRWCRLQGAERVTLSRELSVPEIAQIAKTGVELEVFAHGSICFSYSGVCLLSSFACAGRSANRGMCAQPCRLPYELVDEHGHVLTAPGRDRALCPRDTNTSTMLNELLQAGAHALKLEGRMKAPDYVYAVVDVYRKQLDDYMAAIEPSAEEAAARARKLKRSFNRDFTHEYQHGRSGDEMMSYERSNNRGQEVGTVLDCKPVKFEGRLHRDDKRRRLARVLISLTEPIGRSDLLELRHDDEQDQFLAVSSPVDARAGERVWLQIPRAVAVGARVRVIRSQAAFDEVDAALKQTVWRRRKVAVYVSAEQGRPLRIRLSCVDNAALTVECTGAEVEPARTRAVTREELIEHVGRMGTSLFEAISFDVVLDEGVGMSFSALHKLRATACAELEKIILADVDARIEQARTTLLLTSDDFYTDSEIVVGELRGVGARPAAKDHSESKASLSGEQRVRVQTFGAQQALPPVEHAVPELCAQVFDHASLARARAAGIERVYMPVDALLDEGYTPARAAAEGIIPVLDEVSRASDLARLDPWVQTAQPVAVGTISELVLCQERGAHAELRSCIPLHNRSAAAFLAGAGAVSAWLSPELTLTELERWATSTPLIMGMMVIGRARVMTSEHCMLMAANRCIDDCERCTLRRKRLSLKNIDGKLMPVTTDIHGRSKMYAPTLTDITPQLDKLVRAGITRFMVDLTMLSEAEQEQALAQACAAKRALNAGQKPGRRIAGASAGCLFVGVD
ncbi:U32 family peptidase [Collinsella sp. zg1085]|uniref:peptidase U32 family protein n=1 Tax=Collinsella sp. zg1085 TaxID=2844380 RepID=UPI001C0DD5F7|nr:U32 family peptidase [Collinsella sp. zg1085]QWT17909.1 U32 family peptidase [Collinsella sp. zg1085]